MDWLYGRNRWVDGLLCRLAAGSCCSRDGDYSSRLPAKQAIILVPAQLHFNGFGRGGLRGKPD